MGQPSIRCTLQNLLLCVFIKMRCRRLSRLVRHKLNETLCELHAEIEHRKQNKIHHSSMTLTLIIIISALLPNTSHCRSSKRSFLIIHRLACLKLKSFKLVFTICVLKYRRIGNIGYPCRSSLHRFFETNIH
jgi:hypothetical protein